MTKTPSPRPNDTWMLVAETIGTIQGEIVAGLLRSNEIPVYVDMDNAGSLFPSSAFGQLQGLVRLYVPEEYYEAALLLLEETDPDTPELDEPSIKP